MTKLEDLTQKYQKKTDIEHIKDAPDTYIGSVELDEEKGWLLDEDKMVNKTSKEQYKTLTLSWT